MSSPSQRRGSCGHMMAGYDSHTFCARCRDEKKGKDPCVEKEGADCLHCNALTPEQLVHLSTPSYQIKKEKRESKSSTPAKKSSTDSTLSPTLVDPSLVTVMGVVDGQGTSRSPGLSDQPVEKKKKKENKKASSEKSVKADKSVKSSSHRTSSTSSTDQKLEVMEQKWSDRFNRLEALLLSKSLDRPQEPVFTTVKVAPTHAPPASVSTEPFLKPTDQPVHRPPTSTLPATDPASSATASQAGSDVSPPFQPPGTSSVSDRPTVKKHVPGTLDVTRKDTSSSDSDVDSITSDRPPVDLFPEEGELSDEQDVSLTDPDQSLSEEQSYRETMRGIRSYMGWNHIPDMDSGTKSSDDNPFAGPKMQTPGKVSVALPTDEWLCSKLSKLNLTLTQGYPSRTTEAGTLQRDQFVRTAKSQSKWYSLHSEAKTDSSDSLKSWNTGSSRLNSTYLRIARQAGIASNPPLSRPISQENLRKWERSARESSVICNQAAGFNRCLLKVQQSMQSHLKTIRTESKGKSASKVSTATDELQFLLDFNASVCHAMARAMEHLTDFVFVNVANTTLMRRDSYLSYLKAGVKADTLNALRAAPLDLDTLFPDKMVKQAEEDIAALDRNRSGSVYKKGRYHPYEKHDKKPDSSRQDRPAWKNISSHGQHRRGKGKYQYSTRPAKGQQAYK